ncbi:PepSY domain-containing protein [Alkalihalophilus marmarensis]|jgi:uncharacterized iron-regulated membrane protein|uniref:PepSY domain-containing protein n=1 Tax=Alkalihalophilus marmarensis DSM 21297 TaxID=1188261 RepID=U6SQL8_9BACI|nr:PepSY domain-containing protein [Alkalihalophilus marmarensis]ERN54009.1 hypothetical protein A33I_08540 [Alkalihalophilus marmarensis DSM 21297]MCM3488172.1 PepSY domain-containing protein [Alkalihalophilus marmarensis]
MTKSDTKQSKTHTKQKKSFYQAVWRWHFYAGVIFAPFLLILAISGGVYLFKPQLESLMYSDLYYVKQLKEEVVNPSLQIGSVEETFDGSTVLSLRFNDSADRTNEVNFIQDGVSKTAYINPYDGTIQGSLVNSEKFMEVFKKIHSELLIGGTVANRLVELAACWAIVLLITGLFLWWPRNKASIWGTILPRFRKRGRLFWRDMHAVPAFWLSLFILVLILTGLPWSGVMGDQINRLATSTNTGYPPFALSFMEKPESVVKAGDVADDIPWAQENVPVPESRAAAGYLPLTVDEINEIAHTNGVHVPYTISMPQGETGVFTIATSHSKPGDNATLHIDQYDGRVLTDVRYQDYGILAKVITLGIALHEGRLFGLANQLLGLITCVGLVLIIISSFIMWRKRKPQHSAGAPPKPSNKRTSKIVFFIMLTLGILMPLVGLSIIVVYLLDRFLLSKIKRLHSWYA